MKKGYMNANDKVIDKPESNPRAPPFVTDARLSCACLVASKRAAWCPRVCASPIARFSGDSAIDINVLVICWVPFVTTFPTAPVLFVTTLPPTPILFVTTFPTAPADFPTSDFKFMLSGETVGVCSRYELNHEK